MSQPSDLADEFRYRAEWKPAESVTDGEVVILAFTPYGHPDKDKVVRGIGWRDKAVGVWSIKDFEGFGVWVLPDDCVLGWEHLPEPPKERVR